ncbi:MAG TPA: hypothetical protein VF250_17305 [Conexibacter sp.]
MRLLTISVVEDALDCPGMCGIELYELIGARKVVVVGVDLLLDGNAPGSGWPNLRKRT